MDFCMAIVANGNQVLFGIDSSVLKLNQMVSALSFAATNKTKVVRLH